MITDQQTNTLYLAYVTQRHFKEKVNKITEIFSDKNYNVNFLKETKDYYCRDYMPVQVGREDFVQFVFNPKTYFERSDYKYLSNPVLIQLANQLPEPRYSRIILDGGNIIKWEEKIIITSRVIKDNLFQFNNVTAIINELEELLKCEVIIVPEYPGEKTGHADGLIRFINGNKVFINNMEDKSEKDWLKDFKKILKDKSLEYVSIPCEAGADQKTANGLYINYLHIGDLILLPEFENMADSNNKALDIVRNEFPDYYSVEPFPADWIAKYGGVFNCMSWNILE